MALSATNAAPVPDAQVPGPSSADPPLAGLQALPGSAFASAALWGIESGFADTVASLPEIDATVVGPGFDAFSAAIHPRHDFDIVALSCADASLAEAAEQLLRAHPPRIAVLLIGPECAERFTDSAQLPYDIWFEPNRDLTAAIFTPVVRSVQEREALRAIAAHRTINAELDEVLQHEGDFNEVIAEAMTVMTRGLSCDAASFWRPTVSGRRLMRVGCTGPDDNLDRAAGGGGHSPDPDCDRLMELPVTGTPAGQAFSTGQPGLSGADGDALVLPVRAHGVVVGVIVLAGARTVSRRRTTFELAVWAGDRIGTLVHAHLAYQRFNAVTARSPLAIVLADAQGRIITFNRAAEDLFGVAREDVLDAPVASLLAPGDPTDDAVLDDLIKAAVQGRVQTSEIEVRTVHAGLRSVELTVSAWGEGLDRRVSLTAHDVSDQRAAQRTIAELAFTDRVTGLANEAALLRDLAHQPRIGLIAMAIQRFDRVVDALGSDAANEVLRAVAARLGDAAPDGRRVYHLSRDEFLISVDTERADLMAVAESLRASISERLRCAGAVLYLEARVGAHHADTTSGVRNQLDVVLRALQQARETNSPVPLLYDIENPPDRGRLRRETDLRDAVAGDQLRLVYQPIIDLADRRITHYEALVRWQHPDLGLLTPDQFIPLAEQNGLIVTIGDWVIRECCRQLAEWRDRHGFEGKMSFNLAPRQLLGEGLVPHVQAALGAFGLTGDCLIAEVVESTGLDDVSVARSTLKHLRLIGLDIALDDFGVGESSLGRLAELPVNILKIDRSLIRGVPSDRASRAITRSATELARELGLRVVSEGIETPSQLDYLLKLGCDYGQGFFFSRPVPAAEAIALR